MPPADPPAHGVVLLAAGVSRRLGRSKQLLVVSGETLVRRGARLALLTEPADAVAVVGQDEGDVRNALAGLAIRVVPCADFRLGLGHSLRAGLAALPPACAGALVMVSDQPSLTEGHLVRLRDVWRGKPDDAAASGYAGTIGVPALVPRRWFAELSADLGDRGARDLLRARRAEVLVVIEESLASDIDRPEDVLELR